jgi:hypothetical protein
MDLYLESATDYAIRDQEGREWTPAEAEAAWKAGKVEDCNIAFQRLANMGFDVDKVKQYYADRKNRVK